MSEICLLLFPHTNTHTYTHTHTHRHTHTLPQYTKWHPMCHRSKSGSWNPLCSFTQLLGLCCSVFAHGQIKQSIRMGSSMATFPFEFLENFFPTWLQVELFFPKPVDNQGYCWLLCMTALVFHLGTCEAWLLQLVTCIWHPLISSLALLSLCVSHSYYLEAA